MSWHRIYAAYIERGQVKGLSNWAIGSGVIVIPLLIISIIWSNNPMFWFRWLMTDIVGVAFLGLFRAILKDMKKDE
jgi:hypothetical protein